ncbi:MAG: YfcC family protein, partial [Clostridiales bacterium]
VTLCVSATGYGAAPIGAFNVGVAQGIAGLPLFSGMGFRWILWIVLFTALAFYVYHYAEKVRKDPSKSIVKDIDYSDMEMSHEALNAKLSKRQIGVLLVFLSAISFLIFAAVKGGILGPWYTYSAIFFVMGITAGIVAGYSADKIVEEYVNGCKLLLYAGIVLGTAKAIAIVLEDGMIIDTLVNWLVIPLQAFGGSSQSVAGIIMMFIQILLNLIMPTNSGQALATMPILLPLGDLVGLNKQITVLAFQLGDGLTMMLFPTNGVLMAGLALARVPFDKWMKFAMPLAVIQIGIACIALVVASFINYGPF